MQNLGPSTPKPLDEDEEAAEGHSGALAPLPPRARPSASLPPAGASHHPASQPSASANTANAADKPPADTRLTVDGDENNAGAGGGDGPGRAPQGMQSGTDVDDLDGSGAAHKASVGGDEVERSGVARGQGSMFAFDVNVTNADCAAWLVSC